MIMKSLELIAVLLMASLSTGAQAESWKIDVTLSYINDNRELVEGVPVMSVVVPVGSCGEGLTRTENMIPKPVKVTQKLCVDRDGEQVKITGWVFATQRVRDYIFKERRSGELNYGTPVWGSVAGTSVNYIFGMYKLQALRVN